MVLPERCELQQSLPSFFKILLGSHDYPLRKMEFDLMTDDSSKVYLKDVTLLYFN